MTVHSAALLRSLASAIAAGIVSYVTAWGFFTTHEEINVSPETAWPIAFVVSGSVFLVAVVLYFVRSSNPQKK